MYYFYVAHDSKIPLHTSSHDYSIVTKQDGDHGKGYSWVESVFISRANKKFQLYHILSSPIQGSRIKGEDNKRQDGALLQNDF